MQPRLTGTNRYSARGERVFARNDDRPVWTHAENGLRLVHRFRPSATHRMPDGEDVCHVCIYPRSWHNPVEV
jgi:hypothetical protein